MGGERRSDDGGTFSATAAPDRLVDGERGAVAPFAVRDCALAAVATGVQVQNLRELRDQLVTAHPGCLFNHFWGSLLRPQFDELEFRNDFAEWAARSLHDRGLAERLALIDPTAFRDLESLREAVLEVVESHLDAQAQVPWAARGRGFRLVRALVVVFDTRHRVATPQEFASILPRLSVGSIFYHFIDARRRTPDGADDFRAWLAGFAPAYRDLCRRLEEVDPYFRSLAELRERLATVFATAGEGAAP